MIPQRNLSLLSNRLTAKGGKRIPEKILEQDYCISWFLVGLSESPLKDIFLFKGGTSIKKCYVGDYRFSEDLDFTLSKETSFEDILKYLEIAFNYTYKESGIMFHFIRQDRHTHKNTYTFFIGFEGPLPGGEKEIKVDVTIQEKVVWQILKKKVLREYKEYEDIPEDSILNVYSLNEISAEKIIALLDRARNEPRDLYDIWYLSSHQHVDVSELIDGIELKLEFRGKKLIDVREEFLRKENRFKNLWNTRLSSQISVLPEFDHVYRTVQRELRQAGLLKKRMI